MSDQTEVIAMDITDGITRILDDPSQVAPVFQPVIELSNGQVIGFEALARWPAFHGVNPAAAFDAARMRGSLVELDRWCRRRAVESATAQGMDPTRYLLVNVEPHTLSASSQAETEDPMLSDITAGDIPIILELTERTLLSDPPAMLATVAWARRHSFGIALDDVGSRPECIALLDVIAPDVVKLDRSITQMDDVSLESATVISATAEYARRHGATILAEGIEYAFNAACAEHMGATLGQGFLYGHPGPLPDLPPLAGPRPALISARRGRIRDLRDILAEVPTTIGPLADVTAQCEIVEKNAAEDFAPGCVVATLQGPLRMTDDIGARYSAIGTRHHLVGIVAAGLGPHPLPFVYGPRDADAMSDGVFAVAAIGSDYAVAVVGSGVSGVIDPHNRYRWCVTTERAAVADIARSIAAELAGS